MRENPCTSAAICLDKTLDVDLPMVVAAVGAAAIGQVFDDALLVVTFATSGAPEAVVTKRTEDSVRGALRSQAPRPPPASPTPVGLGWRCRHRGARRR